MIDCLQDRLFGGIVEGDTTYLFLRQLQDFLDVPSDSLSLAVRVACEPNLIGLKRLFAQRINEMHLLLVNDIVGRIGIAKVNTHTVFTNTLDVTDMPLR